MFDNLWRIYLQCGKQWDATFYRMLYKWSKLYCWKHIRTFTRWHNCWKVFDCEYLKLKCYRILLIALLEDNKNCRHGFANTSFLNYLLKEYVNVLFSCHLNFSHAIIIRVSYIVPYNQMVFYKLFILKKINLTILIYRLHACKQKKNITDGKNYCRCYAFSP